MAKGALDVIERVRNRIASFLVGAFVGALVAFTFKTIPPENKDIITYMVGQLSGMATMALGFYFVNKVGQDALDAAKTENTGKALDAITASTKTDEPQRVIVDNPEDEPVPVQEKTL